MKLTVGRKQRVVFQCLSDHFHGPFWVAGIMNMNYPG